MGSVKPQGRASLSDEPAHGDEVRAGSKPLADTQRRQMMEPREIWEARASLGELWGLNRPITWSELGKALRLTGGNPAMSIRDYERGRTIVSGPVSVCIDLFLLGAIPPDGLGEVIERTTEHA